MSRRYKDLFLFLNPKKSVNAEKKSVNVVITYLFILQKQAHARAKKLAHLLIDEDTLKCFNFRNSR